MRVCVFMHARTHSHTSTFRDKTLEARPAFLASPSSSLFSLARLTLPLKL